MTIRMWDWSKGWKNTMIFEGHTHYVMAVAFNPKVRSATARHGTQDCAVDT